MLKGKKTVICNLLATVLPFVPELLPDPYAEAARQIIQNNFDWILASVCGMNIGLRKITAGPETVTASIKKIF